MSPWPTPEYIALLESVALDLGNSWKLSKSRKSLIKWLNGLPALASIWFRHGAWRCGVFPQEDEWVEIPVEIPKPAFSAQRYQHPAEAAAAALAAADRWPALREYGNAVKAVWKRRHDEYLRSIPSYERVSVGDVLYDMYTMRMTVIFETPSEFAVVHARVESIKVTQSELYLKLIAIDGSYSETIKGRKRRCNLLDIPFNGEEGLTFGEPNLNEPFVPAFLIVLPKKSDIAAVPKDVSCTNDIEAIRRLIALAHEVAHRAALTYETPLFDSSAEWIRAQEKRIEWLESREMFE